MTAAQLPPGNSVRRRNREFVATFVFRMTTMPTDNGESNEMSGEQFVEKLPAFDILHRFKLLSFATPPAVSLPAGQPLLTTFGDVFAVGDNLHLAATFERRETGDHRLQLHLVVCRIGFAAAVLDGRPRCWVTQNVRPAARTGISAAGTVGKQLHKRQLASGSG